MLLFFPFMCAFAHTGTHPSCLTGLHFRGHNERVPTAVPRNRLEILELDFYRGTPFPANPGSRGKKWSLNQCVMLNQQYKNTEGNFIHLLLNK